MFFRVLFLTLILISNISAEEIYYPYLRGGQYGIIFDGKIFLNARFDEIVYFESKNGVVKIDDEYFFIDEAGHILKELEVDRVYPISNNRVRFKKNGLYGFFDESGNEVLYGYKHASDFQESKALVREGNERLYIDIDGNYLFKDIVFQSGSLFFENYARINLSNAINPIYAIIDDTGEFIVKPTSIDIGVFRSGLCSFYEENLIGFFNDDCEIIIEPQYYSVFNFYEDVAFVQYRESNGENTYFPYWQLIDIRNNVIKKFNDDIVIVSDFHEGLSGFMSLENESYGKFGFINTKGDIVINPIFDSISFFIGDLSRIVLNDNTGYVNKNGEVFLDDDFSY